MKKLFNILKMKSYRPRWFVAVIVILPALLVLLTELCLSLKLQYNIQSNDAGRGPASVETGFLELTVQQFAMTFCAGCFLISVLILVATIPIYIFSNDSIKSERAGGLAKTCLQFVVGSGAAVLATLSF